MNLFGNTKKKHSEKLQLRLKDEYGIEVYHEKMMLPTELRAKGYRKLQNEALGRVTQIFQYVPQLAVQHNNNGVVQDVFKAAVEGTYRVILDPGTILAKSKQKAGAFRGAELNQVTNKVAGQAEFIENSAILSVSAAPQGYFLDVLANLEQFPLETDGSLTKYYGKIL